MAEVAAVVAFDMNDPNVDETTDFLGDTIATLGTDWIPGDVTEKGLTERFNAIAWARYKELTDADKV